jgi:hypothetical protein
MLTVTQLYTSLLLLDELPTATQWQIFKYGKLNKDAVLLGKLAHHPGLDPQVDESLGKVPFAKARAAWLSRPGRDAHIVEQAIVSEKRITVLKALAEVADLTATARAALIHSADKHSVPALAVLLLTRDDLDPAQQTALVSQVAAKGITGELTYTDTFKFWTFLDGNPEFSEVALSVCSYGYSSSDRVRDTTRLLEYGTQLTPSTQMRVLTNHFGPAMARLVSEPQEVRRLNRMVAEWPAGQMATWRSLNVFVHSQDLCQDARDKVAEMLSTPSAKAWIIGANAAEIAALVRYIGTDDRTAELSEAATSGNAAWLATCVENCDSFDHAKSLALLSNEHLTLEQAAAVAAKLPAAIVWRTAMAMADAKRAAVMAFNHVNHARTQWLALSLQNSELLREIALLVAQSTHSYHMTVVVNSIAAQIGDNSALTLMLPSWVLTSESLSPEARVQIASAIVDSLGDNEQAWAVFESFIESGSGLLLDDAIDAAHLVLGLESTTTQNQE